MSGSASFRDSGSECSDRRKGAARNLRSPHQPIQLHGIPSITAVTITKNANHTTEMATIVTAAARLHWINLASRVDHGIEHL
jgi:hypothetical protein